MGDLGKYACSVDQAALRQGFWEDVLDGGDQATGAVGDDQQRTRQAVVSQIGQEISPGVGRLSGAGGQADEDGFAFGGHTPGGQNWFGP